MSFAGKYDTVPFDANDANQAVAERARGAVLSAYAASISDKDSVAPRELEFICAGLLVGCVQVLQSCAEPGDTSDAAIRSSIIQTTAWAVDMARALAGHDPLADHQ